MEKKTEGLFVFVLISSLTIFCLDYFKFFGGDQDDSLLNMRDKNVKVFENINKSPYDKRLYRGLRLPNNLTALLISDPTTDIAAASLAVTAGSINEHVPGLAHFLEHMLFMGSKKYPQENDFEQFISKHAGATNAFTDVEITNFQFQIDAQYLTPTLDRFAQFFIAPLLAPSAIEREVNAVNSEHKMYIADDYMRIDQLEILMSKPKHPYNHFFTGNLETLMKEPASRGVSIRDELSKFYSTWYSSNIMNLVVLGKESLNELEHMVTSLFGEIENKNITPKVHSFEDHPWGPEQVKHKVFIVPIADVHLVKLIFPTPSVDDKYKTAPAFYLVDLIGHEGRGSLHSTLRRRGLIENSHATYFSYCGFGFFSIEFSLTEEAASRLGTVVDEIVTTTFQYIHLLKTEGIQEWIFNEDKKTNEMEFKYKDKESPLLYAISLSPDMHAYPIEDIITCKYLSDEWRPELIEEYLGFLTPNNMNIFIVDQYFEDIADQTEKYYGIKYKVDMMPDSVLEKWETIDLAPELHLPPPNDFVTENFSLYPFNDKNDPKSPCVIQESSVSRFWFKQDNLFQLPKLNIRFEILSPIVSSSPSNRNLLEIFAYLFRDTFDECAYAATMAKLQWTVQPSDKGLYIELSGFNEKLPKLLSILTSNLTNFKVDETRLKILKDLHIRDLNNFEAEELYTYATAHFRFLTQEKQWTMQELLGATEVLQTDKVQEFISKLFSKVYIQGLIHGNTNEQEALNIVKIIEESFNKSIIVGALPEEVPQARQIEIRDGSNLRYEISNKYHPHSSLYAYYQCSTESALNNTLMELFVQIIEEPCFNVLRTKEQLGYLVYCSVRRISGVQGLAVMVESEKHPLYVNSRVEAFLDSVKELLDNMTEKEFEAHKTALATKKLEKPKQLDRLSDKFWYEIGNKLYNFERQEKEVKQLKLLKKRDILDFYKKSIAKSSSKRRKLSVNVLSEVTNPELPKNLKIEGTKIESLDAFRKTAKYLPLPHPYTCE